jgi:hypothetical protein
MICHFCHGPACAEDEPVDVLVRDGARCCVECITTGRVVCCVTCEDMVRVENARERPDLGESPMGGSWLCDTCAPTEPAGRDDAAPGEP